MKYDQSYTEQVMWQNATTKRGDRAILWEQMPCWHLHWDFGDNTWSATLSIHLDFGPEQRTQPVFPVLDLSRSQDSQQREVKVSTLTQSLSRKPTLKPSRGSSHVFFPSNTPGNLQDWHKSSFIISCTKSCYTEILIREHNNMSRHMLLLPV